MFSKSTLSIASSGFVSGPTRRLWAQSAHRVQPVMVTFEVVRSEGEEKFFSEMLSS